MKSYNSFILLENHFFTDNNWLNIQDGDYINTWRGTDYNLPLYRPTKNLFLSTSKVFAEDYGKNIFNIKIKTNRIFNSLSFDSILWLMNEVGYLEDSFGKYETEEELKYDTEWESDSWELIENNLDYLWGEYDTIIISEGGAVNIIIQDESNIIKIEKL